MGFLDSLLCNIDWLLSGAGLLDIIRESQINMIEMPTVECILMHANSILWLPPSMNTNRWTKPWLT